MIGNDILYFGTGGVSIVFYFGSERNLAKQK
jgi:hypothetical protein